MISVLILTKNEEIDLASCLESIKWCDDIHILDSFSTDSTEAIARSYKVNFVQRTFDGYSSQRNAGLKNIPYKYGWILILDADERIPSELVEIMKNAINSADLNTNGFRIRRRDFFNDTWLKHAQISPFYIRLVRAGKALYHREINEVITVEGNVVDIPGYFDHYPFSKGIKHWVSKHNVYSTMEAQRWIDEHNGKVEFSLKEALFGADFNVKRYHQKGLFYKLPGRPIIKWLYMVLWRRSFLDGKAGLTYSTLQSIYEYFIILKTKELLRSIDNKKIPK